MQKSQKSFFRPSDQASLTGPTPPTLGIFLYLGVNFQKKPGTNIFLRHGEPEMRGGGIFFFATVYMAGNAPKWFSSQIVMRYDLGKDLALSGHLSRMVAALK